MHEPTLLDRSAFLRSALFAVGGLAVGSGPGCAAASGLRRRKVLLAYFSRPGENYYYGGRINLKVGNTEVVARMISKLIHCDVHRIEPTNPYPHHYEKTVARNVREQEAGARPRIANPLPSIARYEVVLLASPIWNVRAPDDHVDLRRELRLQREDGLSDHDVRDERTGNDARRLRRLVSRRSDRHRSRGAR
jgi:hypothetical protein